MSEGRLRRSQQSRRIRHEVIETTPDADWLRTRPQHLLAAMQPCVMGNVNYSRLGGGGVNHDDIMPNVDCARNAA